MVHAVEAQIQNVDSVETGFKNQTGLIGIRYSVTINDLQSNSRSNFQCNVVNVIRM
jgi:hypothetical protein